LVSEESWSLTGTMKLAGCRERSCNRDVVRALEARGRSRPNRMAEA
jgi:hypothetical protein